jgi:ABC-type glycerol-3-phosphate transport system permease component
MQISVGDRARASGRPINRVLARRLGRWVLHALLLLTATLFVLPSVWMIVSSLKASTEIFAQPMVWWPANPQWQNYLRAFEVLPLARFIGNTLLVVALATLGTVLSSALVGYAFARLRWPGRQFWFGILLATMLLPDVITIVPRFILFRNLGWLDTFLPLIVPYWTATSALYVFLLRQFFRGIPLELEEAARIDGAGRLRTLFLVVLPLARPALVSVGIFALIQHYNDFLNPLIYLNSQHNWTLALALRAYNDAYARNWELVFAASTIMLIPMVALFLMAQRSFVEGIATTGFGGR